MSKILIWREIVPGSDIDIFGETDYQKLDIRLQEIYGKGGCPNWGNKLWFQGLYSEIDTPENQIFIRTKETAEEINEKYDLIIYPMANFFSVEYAMDTSTHVEAFKKIKIPIYIIACGAQANNYGDIEGLVQKIGDSSSRFIEAIYQTGGEFALRGHFTKEFFERLGFHDAVVTGCPSMYQMGSEFRVNTLKVQKEEIKPIITGKLNAFEGIMKKIPDSIYLSQDLYEDFLYRPNILTKLSFKSDILFTYNYSIYQAELLGQGRIKMIVDTKDWYHYIKNNHFNFAFGTKIHGSIMPILAGCPAVLVAIDSRTMEMADFFNIPYLIKKNMHKYSLDEFYDAYEKMDYTKFNQSYLEKYTNYENFLIKHKIVKKINQDNSFFKKEGTEKFDDYQPNRNDFARYAKKLKRKRLLMKPLSLALSVRNSVRQ